MKYFVLQQDHVKKGTISTEERRFYLRDKIKENEERILNKEEYMKVLHKKMREVEIYIHKNTLKITFPNRKVNMIKFHVKDEQKQLLNPDGGILTITAIGKCAVNYFNGTSTPQLILEDFEIMNKKKWDF